MKIKYEIVSQTTKALLIEANGRRGWIQKRWGKDGMVKKETFEKAADSFEEQTSLRYVPLYRKR